VIILVIAGIGILNMLLLAVPKQTDQALGGEARQIATLFLLEAR
jgi:hypothetical protein